MKRPSAQERSEPEAQVAQHGANASASNAPRHSHLQLAPSYAPAGPETLTELLSWADQGGGQILSDQSSTWLQSLQRGICVGTHFSGLKTPEIALEQLLRATKHWMPAVDVRHKLTQAWSCDRARECLEVALSYEFDPELWAPKSARNHHIFNDILDYLTPEALNHVSCYKKHRQGDKKREALQTLQSYLMTHPDQALGSARCWTHRGQCRCTLLSAHVVTRVFDYS